jgi:CspA family cold shock protein
MERAADATATAGISSGALVRRDDSIRRPMVTGKIRTLRVDKGFGFIKDETGKEYFFHQSAVYGEGLENLREGDSVEFDVGEGPKGPRAENVRRTST